VSPIQYAYSAASGALIIMGLDFYQTGQYWCVGFSAVGFLFALYCLWLQPSNVDDGLIVHRSALTVFAFVHDRPVVWCGTRRLHDMHVHSQQEPVSNTTLFANERDVVCLGHECHCPDVHMQKVGQE
jgi:hypothetical protein